MLFISFIYKEVLKFLINKNRFIFFYFELKIIIILYDYMIFDEW